MADNEDLFRDRMRAVREGSRKKFSVCLEERPGLPAARGRLAAREPYYSRRTNDWALILERRSGWFGVTDASGGQAMVFLYTWQQRTYFVDLAELAVPGGAANGKPLFHRIPFHWRPCVLSLRRLEDTFQGKAGVFALTLRASADARAISLWAGAAPMELLEPLPKPKREKAEDAGKEGTEADDEEEDTDDE